MDTTDGEQGAAASVASVVEYSLRGVVGGTTTTEPGTVGWTRTSTLNWFPTALDGEDVSPAAALTWSGHAPLATDRTRAASADLGSPDRAPEPDPDPGPATTPDLALAPGGPLAAGETTTSDLAGLPVGADLVQSLAELDVAGLGDGELLDAAARWQEVISWATAMQSRALGALASRRSWTEEHNAAAAEVSARLRVPQGEANKHMARGAGLAEHPQVMRALQDAVIDTAKADILLRSGNPLSVEEREQAITLYLPQAPDRTRRWLRDRMNAFAARLHGVNEMTKHAMTRRAVYLDPADNSMAWLSANLPASDAAAVWDAIEQAAHTLRRAPGATSTLAQARADALVAIATGRIIVPPQARCAPASADGASAGAATKVMSLTSTEGTVPPRAVAGTSEDSENAVLPRTTVPATGCTCGGCTCDGASVRVIPVRPQVRVTVPATMLLGVDDAPGHLDGYGPVPADLAARIATDATWQRLLTDPVTGILTDYSTTTYQPGKVLRQAVTARDQTCAFPQCDRPARWNDLDHIVPFDHDAHPATLRPGARGQTRADNLQPLCRTHHLAKTHHGWDPVRHPETGVTTWTAPTGHTYTRPPTTTGSPVGHASDVRGPEANDDVASDDVTSLADDTRHRLGHLPPVIDDVSTEQRLFPDEPPF